MKKITIIILLLSSLISTQAADAVLGRISQIAFKDQPANFTAGVSGEGSGLTNLTITGLLRSNVTYSFTPVLTATIQAQIDSVPRNLGGYTATFNFGAGEYTNAFFNFSNFMNGNVNIGGVAVSNDIVHTNQSTIFNCTTASTVCITANYLNANLMVHHIKFLLQTSDLERYGIYPYNCFGQVWLYSNYFLSDSTVNGRAIQLNQCPSSYIAYNAYCNIRVACHVYLNSKALIRGCAVLGSTNPVYGTYCHGGMAQKWDTNTTGSTEDTVIAGGLIITSAGLITP